MINKNICLDSFETKQETYLPETADMTFKGWNINNLPKLVEKELEDWFETEVNNIKIGNFIECAFTCSQWYDGTHIKDEFSHSGFYIDFVLEWKKGLGKCTQVTVYYEVKEDFSNLEDLN